MKTLKKFMDENFKKGEKFMDVDADRRNKKDMVIASRENLSELKELYGAEEIMLFLRKGHSTYLGCSEKFSLESNIVIFERVKEKMQMTIPRSVAQALALGEDTDSEDFERFKNATASAMKFAIDGLPEAEKAKVLARMGQAMSRGGIPDEYIFDDVKKAKPDEDSLLDDILS